MTSLIIRTANIPPLNKMSSMLWFGVIFALNYTKAKRKKKTNLRYEKKENSNLKLLKNTLFAAALFFNKTVNPVTKKDKNF